MGVCSPNMPSADPDPTQVVDGLVGAIRNLASDNNYKIVADLFNEALSLKEQNARLSMSHRELLEQYREFRNELDSSEAKLKSEKAALESIVDEKTKSLADLEEVKSQLDAELAEKNTKLEEREKAFSELEEVKSKVDAELIDTTTKLDEKTKELADLEEVKAKLDADLAEANATLEARAKELAELGEAKTAVEGELSETKATLEEKEKSLTELGEAKAAVDGELAQAKTTLEEKDKSISELEEAKSKLEGDLTDCNAKLDAKSNELAEVTEAKSQVDAELAETKTKLEEESSAKAAVETELGETKTSLEEERTKSEGLEQEIASLRQTIEAKDAEIERLQGEVARMQDELNTANSSLENLRQDLASVQQEMQIKSVRLAELERYSIQLKNEPEDKYVKILDTIWTSILNLAESTFSQDLEPKVLSDGSCWTNLRSCEYLKHAMQLPLPQSNSPAAKQMRVAAIIAVMSRALNKYIFRPTYLIDDDAQLTQLLRDLEDDNPAQELHCRSTLLAILPEKEKMNAIKRVQTVVREVSWIVQHLLSALQYESFHAALEASCKLACTQWRKIQEAQMKIEPYFGPPYDDYDWQVLPLPEFEDSSPLNSDTDTAVEPHEHADAVVDDDDGEDDGDEADSDEEVEPDAIMFVVWPTMCAVEGGALNSITQGLVISKEQSRPALEEVRSRRAPRPAQKRARSMSMSMRSHGVNGSPKPNKAFLYPDSGEGDGGGLKDSNDGSAAVAIECH